MALKPRYKKAAMKYLDGQPLAVQTRILTAIAKLPEGDVRKMEGREGYRLTVGGFRVLFDYTDEYTDEGLQIIDVSQIGPRGDIYKK